MERPSAQQSREGGFRPARKHVIREESQIAEKSGGFVLPKHLKPPKKFTTRSQSQHDSDGALIGEEPYDMSVHDCQNVSEATPPISQEEDMSEDVSSEEELTPAEAEAEFRAHVKEYADQYGLDKAQMLVKLELDGLRPKKKKKTN